jgi:hypothetical protein
MGTGGQQTTGTANATRRLCHTRFTAEKARDQCVHELAFAELLRSADQQAVSQTPAIQHT